MKTEEIKKELQNLEKATGKSLEELLADFEGFKEQEKKLVPDKPEEVILKRAMGQFKLELRETYGNLDPRLGVYTGFIFGETGLLDFVEIMKNKKMWQLRQLKEKHGEQEGLSKAIDQNIVNSKEEPIDTREKIGFRANDDYLKPLKGHSFSRTVFGIAGGSEKFLEPKVCHIHYDKDLAMEVQFETFKWLRWRAGRRKEPSFYNLNGVKATKFQGFGLSLDIEETIEKVMKPLTLEKLRMKWDMSKVIEDKSQRWIRKRDPNDIVVVKADVASIGQLNERTNSRSLLLSDPDLGFEEFCVVSYAPAHVVINFGKGSTIYNFGYLDTSVDADKQERPIIRTYGIYALEDYWRPPESSPTAVTL